MVDGEGNSHQKILHLPKSAANSLLKCGRAGGIVDWALPHQGFDRFEPVDHLSCCFLPGLDDVLSDLHLHNFGQADHTVPFSYSIEQGRAQVRLEQELSPPEIRIGHRAQLFAFVRHQRLARDYLSEQPPARFIFRRLIFYRFEVAAKALPTAAMALVSEKLLGLGS